MCWDNKCMVTSHVKTKIYVERKKEPHGILLSRPFINWFPRDTGKRPGNMCLERVRTPFPTEASIWDFLLSRCTFGGTFRFCILIGLLGGNSIWGVLVLSNTKGTQDLHFTIGIGMLTSWPQQVMPCFLCSFNSQQQEFYFILLALKNKILYYKWGV